MAYASWSVVFGEQPSAAKWNILGTNDAHFYSFLGDNLAWQTWVPTFTNFTKGSASIDAKYTQVGNTVFFRLRVVLNGSTMGTIPTFSLPVASTNLTFTDTIGYGRISDTGTAGYISSAKWATTTTATMTYLTSSEQNITATQPMTWVNTDWYQVQGFYEAA